MSRKTKHNCVSIWNFSQKCSSMHFNLRCWKGRKRSCSAGKSNVALILVTDNSLTVFGAVISILFNFFLRHPVTEFLMRQGFFQPTWRGLIFFETNWSYPCLLNDGTIAYFSMSLHLSVTQLKSLFSVFWGDIITIK